MLSIVRFSEALSSAANKPKQCLRYTLSVLPVTEHVDRGGKNREDNDAEDDRQEIAINVGNEAPEEVSKQRKPDGPKKPAEDIVRKEVRVAHRSHAGEDGRKGPDDGKKASEDDRLSPMLRVKAFGAKEVLAMEEERILAREDLSPDAVAERVAHGVSAHRGNETEERQGGNAKDLLRGKKSGREQKAVSREEKADQQSGFRKHDREHPRVPDELEEFAEIEHAVQYTSSETRAGIGRL